MRWGSLRWSQYRCLALTLPGGLPGGNDSSALALQRWRRPCVRRVVLCRGAAVWGTAQWLLGGTGAAALTTAAASHGGLRDDVVDNYGGVVVDDHDGDDGQPAAAKKTALASVGVHATSFTTRAGLAAAPTRGGGLAGAGRVLGRLGRCLAAGARQRYASARRGQGTPAD